MMFNLYNFFFISFVSFIENHYYIKQLIFNIIASEEKFESQLVVVHINRSSLTNLEIVSGNYDNQQVLVTYQRSSTIGILWRDPQLSLLLNGFFIFF